MLTRSTASLSLPLPLKTTYFCYIKYRHELYRRLLRVSNANDKLKLFMTDVVDFIFANTAIYAKANDVDSFSTASMLRRNVDYQANEEDRNKIFRLIDFIEMMRRINNGETEDCLDVVQAPKGWKCSICLSHSMSHLCKKTKCNHYYHVQCYNEYVKTARVCAICKCDM